MLKRFLGVIVAFVAFTLVGATQLAHAAPVPDDVNSVARIQISALAVQIALGTVVPLFVGLLTKLRTHPGVKSVVMLVLNAVQTLIVQATMADGTAVVDKSTFIAWVLAVVTSVGTYFGVYKPLNVTSSTPQGKLGPYTGPL